MNGRKQWVAMLARMVAPMDAANAAKGLTAILPMLDHFPDSAFTIASLEHVASNSKFVPNYHELCEHLGAWWKAHRPQPTAIAADQDATVKQREIERQVRESWETITADQVRRKIRELDGNPLAAVLGSFLAAAINKHTPQHLPLLPPAWLKSTTEPDNVVALRKPAAAFTIHHETKRGPPIEDAP